MGEDHIKTTAPPEELTGAAKREREPPRDAESVRERRLELGGTAAPWSCHLLVVQHRARKCVELLHDLCREGWCVAFSGVELVGDIAQRAVDRPTVAIRAQSCGDLRCRIRSRGVKEQAEVIAPNLNNILGAPSEDAVLEAKDRVGAAGIGNRIRAE